MGLYCCDANVFVVVGIVVSTLGFFGVGSAAFVGLRRRLDSVFLRSAAA